MPDLLARSNRVQGAHHHLACSGAMRVFGQAMFQSPLRWVVILSPFAVVLYMMFKAQNIAASTARTLLT